MQNQEEDVSYLDSEYWFKTLKLIEF
jgi:hypothetical protein